MPRPLTPESRTQCLRAPSDIQSTMQAGSTALVAGEDMNRVMDSGPITLASLNLISTSRPGNWAELGEVDLDISIADVSSWVQFDSLVRHGISCLSRLA